MASKRRFEFDTLRSLEAASILTTFVPIGTEVNFNIRKIIVQNKTDADIYFSDDGINDKFMLSSGSDFVLDISNADVAGGTIYLPSGIKFFAKRVAVATTGSVFVTVMYTD